ncbi:MAG: YqeG family HAD IIIA-type phosphatase, partial [Clostridia bacterium]
MKNWFRADMYFDEVYEITPAILKSRNIKTVFVDLDNTLADYDTPVASDKVHAWISSIESAGIAVAIVSNNNETRVEKFCAMIETARFARSGKPWRRGIGRVITATGASRESTALIGDKILTDV